MHIPCVSNCLLGNNVDFALECSKNSRAAARSFGLTMAPQHQSSSHEYGQVHQLRPLITRHHVQQALQSFCGYRCGSHKLDGNQDQRSTQCAPPPHQQPQPQSPFNMPSQHHGQLVGGRICNHLPQWCTITSDKWVPKIIQRDYAFLSNIPHHFFHRPLIE